MVEGWMRGVWEGADRGENGIINQTGSVLPVGSSVQSVQSLDRTGRAGTKREGGALWAK